MQRGLQLRGSSESPRTCRLVLTLVHDQGSAACMTHGILGEVRGRVEGKMDAAHMPRRDP